MQSASCTDSKGLNCIVAEAMERHKFLAHLTMWNLLYLAAVYTETMRETGIKDNSNVLGLVSLECW